MLSKVILIATGKIQADRDFLTQKPWNYLQKMRDDSNYHTEVIPNVLKELEVYRGLMFSKEWTTKA